MAGWRWPVPRQHPRIELFYDGAWHNHASRVYTRRDIEISRGRGDEQGEPTPGSASLSLSNLNASKQIDHRYNPRDPRSDLYGKIGRNTPVRISNGPAAALEDDFTRTVTDSWAYGPVSWVLSGTTSLYSWDAGVQGWVGEGATSVAQVASPAHDGAGALRATMAMGSGFSAIRCNDAQGLRDISAAGPTLMVWVLVPKRARGTGWQARIEVQDAGFVWQAGPDFDLTPGTWALLSYTPAGGLLAACRSIGVQVSAEDVDATQAVYIDTMVQMSGTADVDGSHGIHTHAGTNALQYSTSDTGSTNHRVRAVVRLSAATVTGAAVSTWVLGRYTDASNYYAALVSMNTIGEVSIGIYKRVGGVLSAVAAPVTTHASYGGLFDTYQFAIELYVEGPRLYAKIWDHSNHAEPGSWNLTAVDTDLTAGTYAGVADRRETGNTNANLAFEYDSFAAVGGTIRFTGQVASWRPRRALGGDAWTEITARGVLHRLEQGATPLRSALWRTNLAGEPIAFWPCDDGVDAETLASALPGGSPLTIETDGGYTFREVAAWLEPLITPETGAFILLEGLVNQDPADTQWSGDFVFCFDADASGAIFFSWEGYGSGSPGSPRNEWTLLLFDDSPGVLGYQLTCQTFDGTVSGHTILADDTIALIDGRPHHARVTTSNSGANTGWGLLFDGEPVASGTTTGPWDVVRGVFYDWDATDGQISVGMAVVWDTAGPPADAADAAFSGWAAEPVAARLARLCLEKGIPFTLIGDAADTPAMGPQPIDTLVGQFAECERTDGGQLFETRIDRGVTYRTRRDLYNQAAALALDFDSPGVAEQLDPDIDDQQARNDITVANRFGSSVRVVQQTGPLNVQDPDDDPDGVGEYETRHDVNTDGDTTLTILGHWQLHLRTVQETRYPAITVDLGAAPSYAGDVDLLDLGDRLTLDNLEPDQVDQLTPGYTETIGTHSRINALNCVPASPYRIFTLDHPVLGRLETGGSQLAAQFEAGTDTSMSVTVTGDALWDTTDVPFDIVALGVRLTVTAVAGASSPQTFTVEQTPANAVAKTIPAGTPITTYGTGVLAL
jgi:hypothetical protein